MIEEQYVSFETAKLLKENGFDEECWCYYHNSRLEHYFREVSNRGWTTTGNVAAPTQQMAMRWLREVHKLNVEVCLNAQGYEGIITILFNGDIKIVTVLPVSKHDTWEEAAEVAIRYCLEKLI